MQQMPVPCQSRLATAPRKFASADTTLLVLSPQRRRSVRESTRCQWQPKIAHFWGERRGRVRCSPVEVHRAFRVGRRDRNDRSPARNAARGLARRRSRRDSLLGACRRRSAATADAPAGRRLTSGARSMSPSGDCTTGSRRPGCSGTSQPQHGDERASGSTISPIPAGQAPDAHALGVRPRVAIAAERPEPPASPGLVKRLFEWVRERVQKMLHRLRPSRATHRQDRSAGVDVKPARAAAMRQTERDLSGQLITAARTAARQWGNTAASIGAPTEDVGVGSAGGPRADQLGDGAPGQSLDRGCRIGAPLSG